MSVDATFVRLSAGKLGEKTHGSPRDAVGGRDRVRGESRMRAEASCNRQISRQGGFPIIEATFQIVAYIDKWTIVIDLPNIYESSGNIRENRPGSKAPKYFRDCFVIRLKMINRTKDTFATCVCALCPVPRENLSLRQ